MNEHAHNSFPAVATACRELAHRASNGISVRLCWHPREDEVYVHVVDERADEELFFNPPKREALSAFYHPYAVARDALSDRKIAA